MVRLTLNKPYTLHARSIDRITGTPSDYKLNLKDPITCDDDHHIKAPRTFTFWSGSYFFGLGRWPVYGSG